jgi:hypothetical protein
MFEVLEQVKGNGSEGEFINVITGRLAASNPLT